MNNHNVTAEFPNLPPRLAGLADLAENLWWSWHPAARMLFKMINRQAWKASIHNPDKMLKEIPREVLQAAADNPDYMRSYDLVMYRYHKYMIKKGCSLLPESCIPAQLTIAYFSAEYGLHRSLPFYAGGLGFLAGDFLKECSDLNVPMIAVGFMYPGGYVNQRISEAGWQESVSLELDRNQAAIAKVLDGQGKQLIVKVPIIEPPIYVAVWRVDVGRVPLYLLDTDIDNNDPWNRGISSRLYTGDLEQRLRQEIVLGIGGMEVLEALHVKHSVVHLNEGHAAFALLERLRDRFVLGFTREDAFETVRKTTVFTTHTPVPAGHDVFPFPLMEKYFRDFWPLLQMDRDSFFKLGLHPDEPNRGFNMTAFALRLSGYRNGVSRKHGEVANKMWQGLWSEADEADHGIDYVTNGVHVPTWIEPKFELLFNKYLGTDWLEDHDNPYLWKMVDEIPDDELWKTHLWLKIKLFNVIRERARQRWTNDRSHPSMALACGTLLDPSVLTIGFARRFATYKRADLIFHDEERLRKLLGDQSQPLQIVFAGKAHPADDPGKLILQKIFNAARNPDFFGRIAFVEDYGEQVAQYLVHGVDVWLNTPVFPLEACGTSGMKASLNGVPHCSIPDGWWLEAFNGVNGWSFDGGDTGGSRDQIDAESLYRVLEEKIVPLYYRVDENGVPSAWVQTMKNAIKSTAAQFSARRMVREYVDKFYSKAALFTSEVL
ncbi:MAG: alpha-glucan family phosphorylase [Deltaproteobacteria bacterium]|nr:alpha-glucan family phosphorylase [Deltaproteobacteria bacterium]